MTHVIYVAVLDVSQLFEEVFTLKIEDILHVKYLFAFEHKPGVVRVFEQHIKRLYP